MRLTDTLPVSLTYVSHGTSAYTPVYTSGFGTVTVDGQTLVWELGNVEPGWYGYLYLSAQLIGDAVPETTVVNTVSVSAVGESDTADNADSHPLTVLTPRPDLWVSKSRYSGSFYAGDEVTYRVYVGNQGVLTATNARLTDTLSFSTTLVDEWGAPSDAVVDGNTLAWDIGDLPPGSSDYVYVRVLLDPGLVPGTVITNEAEVSVALDEIDLQDNLYQYASQILTPLPDMYVSKSHSEGAFYNGYYVTYRLYWSNQGRDLAHNVRLTDTLPLSMTYDSYWGYSYTPTHTTTVPTPTIEDNTVVWSLGDVEAGWYGSLYLKAWIDEATPAGTYLENQASISVDPAESDVYDNVSSYAETVQAATPELSVSKWRNSGDFWAGRDVTYAISWHNNGYDVAQNVSITDTLPAGLTYSGSWGADYEPEYHTYPLTPTVTGDTIVWQMVDLGPQSDGYVYLTATLASDLTVGTPLTNHVSISTSSSETNPSDNTAYVLNAVDVPDPDLELSKYLYGSLARDSEITYRLYYYNRGYHQPAWDTVLTDTLPAGLTFRSAEWWPSQDQDLAVPITPTISGQMLTFDMGTIPGRYDSGYSGYIYVRAHVSPALSAGTTVINRAGITTTYEIDPGDNTTQHSGTIVEPTYDLYVTTGLNSPYPVTGHPMTYSVSLSNRGNASIGNVVLTQTLPVSATFLAAVDNYGGAALPDRIVVDADGRQQLIWEVGTLDGYNGLYDDLTLYVSALLGADIAAGTPLLNEVEAWGDRAEIPNSYQNYASHLSHAQAPNYDLALTKTFDENQNVTPGERVSFYITTRNTGNLTVQDVVMVDSLPAGLTYDSSSSIYGWTITADGQTITYTADSLAPDYYEGWYLYAIVSDTAVAGELLTNTITISSLEADDDPTDNEAAALATADVVQHDLSLEKSVYNVEDHYAAGTRVTWRLRYQNTGNITQQAVVITDNLPPSTMYDSTYAGNDSCCWTRTTDGNEIIWRDDGTLSVNESGYLYVSTIINAGLAPGTMLTNSVSIASDALAGITATHTITTEGPAIAVSPSPLMMDDAFAGYSRDYYLRIDNLGYGTLAVFDVQSSSPVLSVAPYSFTVGSSGGRVIATTFVPTQTGAFTGTVTFLSNDYNTPALVVTAAAVVTEAPFIAVSPPTIVEGLEPGQRVTRTLSISNTGASPLRFEVGNSTQPALEEVLNNLNQNYLTVNSIVPSRYDFYDGTSGSRISDGGYDMYDYGNYLSTNLGGYLTYQDNAVVGSSYLGATGRYFTRKYPGLFVLGADLDGVGEFRISGGLGADGLGDIDGTALSLRYFGTTYYGFVKRVYGAYEPSVNHLIIVADEHADHTFSVNTDLDDHTVYDLEGADRLYYLLYASRDSGVGTYIDNVETMEIMRAFLDAIEADALPAWVSALPLTGSVPVSGSVPLDVVLDSSGLITGTYTTTMTILSNDPVTPEVTVPLTLYVAGDPLPVVIPAMPDFGISYVGYTYTQALTVANQGTADLQITAISVQHPALSVVPQSLQVPLGESRPLTLTYAPTTVGALSATLALSSNSTVSPVLQVPIVGQAMMPPVIGVLPPALEVTVTAGLSPTVPLTIANTGASDLSWAVAHYGDYGGRTVRTVGLVGSGSAALYSQFSTDPVLDRFSFVDVGNGYTLSSIDGYDMVVVSEGDSGVSTAEADALYAYYQAGGPVILGMDDVNDLLSTTRSTLYQIFGVTNARDGTFYPGATSDHPIAEDVTSLNYVAGDNDYFDENGAEWVVRGSDDNYYFLAYEGSARTVIMGENMSAWYSANPDLVRNALLWAGRGWLSLAPESGTVAASTSQTLSATLNATRLVTGTYTATIGVESNDPATPYLTVPVTLNVVGSQAITVSPTVLDFGTAHVGFGHDLALGVSNEGASPLVVSGAAATDPTLTLSESSFTVAPYGHHDLVVSYTPIDTTPLTASIVLTSNDAISPVVTVPVHGRPVPAPDVATTPASYNVEQDTGLVTTRTLLIENAGPASWDSNWR